MPHHRITLVHGTRFGRLVVLSEEPRGRARMAERAAGRALDAGVAERIMGWIWIEMIEGDGEKWLMPPSSIGRGTLVHDTAKLAGAEARRAPNWNYSVPPYSTDIAAAMTVAEHMRGLGYTVEIRLGANDRKAWVWLIGPDWKHPNQSAFEDSLEFAMCLAALKAAAQASADGGAG